MILMDFHCHTTFSDGKNTPEETVRAAIAAGMTHLGISDHSRSPLHGICKGEDYGMTQEQEGAYIVEIARLKEKYGTEIKLLCGIEQDYTCGKPDKDFDYVIGSVHYIKGRSEFYPIDLGKEKLLELVNDGFGGDIYALAETYFATVGDVVRTTGANVIGHFDLITKYNEGGKLFDESHPRYRAAWQAAVDALLPYGVPFEINTGAISRGYRTTPYPACEIVDYIKSKGGCLILGSDAHSAAALRFGFDKFEHLLHQ